MLHRPVEVATLSRHSQVGEVCLPRTLKRPLPATPGPSLASQPPPRGCHRVGATPGSLVSTDTPDTTRARPAAAIPSDAPGSLSCQRSEHLENRAEVWDFSRLGRPDDRQHRLEARIAGCLMTQGYLMGLGKRAFIRPIPGPRGRSAARPMNQCARGWSG